MNKRDELIFKYGVIQGRLDVLDDKLTQDEKDYKQILKEYDKLKAKIDKGLK